MHKVILIDEKSVYSNKIIDIYKKNQYLNKNEIIHSNSFTNINDIIDDYISQNISIDLILHYTQDISIAIKKLIETNYSRTIRIFIYTKLTPLCLNEAVFSEKVNYIFFIKNRETEMINKLCNCLLTRNPITNIPLTKTQTKNHYLENVLYSIYPNQHLLGYNYLYNVCSLCISNPTILGFKIKDLYSEISDCVGADIEAIDRSIRNFINKGIKNDNLENFYNYIEAEHSLFKITNAHIIHIITINYLNKNSKTIS